MITVGVISDTHGLLRPEAVAALRGVSMILHAGDVGSEEVLVGLSHIAPVHAIAGNVDPPGWLPASLTVRAGEARLHLIHRLEDLEVPAPICEAVIFGHSHKPAIGTREGALYLNPGSAGRRRFRLPVTIARLRINGLTIEPEIVSLV